jgi:hypothetical protein
VAVNGLQGATSHDVPAIVQHWLFRPLTERLWVQTNTFEELHAKEQLGLENAPGIDALVGILEERLATYRTFAPSRLA